MAKTKAVKVEMGLVSHLPKARMKAIVVVIKKLMAAKEECEKQGLVSSTKVMELSFQALEYDLIMEFANRKPTTEPCGKPQDKVVWKPVKVKA